VEQWIERGLGYLMGPNGGLMALAAGAGAYLHHKFLMPAYIKPLLARIKELEERADAADERAAKYDVLMEELAKGRLAKLEDNA